MLLSVVGVNCVSHVGTEQETSVDSLEVLLLVERGERAEDALRDLDSHVAISTLCRL